MPWDGMIFVTFLGHTGKPPTPQPSPRQPAIANTNRNKAPNQRHTHATSWSWTIAKSQGEAVNKQPMCFRSYTRGAVLCESHETELPYDVVGDCISQAPRESEPTGPTHLCVCVCVCVYTCLYKHTERSSPCRFESKGILQAEFLSLQSTSVFSVKALT